MQQSIYVPKLHLGKRRIDIFPHWIGLLILGLLFGAVGGYQVLRYGLSVTGLNDQVPWGLWIVMDITSIALGGGAFTMGVIVYLLKLKQFESIGRLAVLIGFLCYSTASLVLLFDLGQPLRFWHPMIFWQPHSLLWEVTICVVLYLNVLILEMFPTIVEHPFFDRFPILRRITHILHRFGPALAIAGLTLSLLHQASLGATYGVLSGRGMWFRPAAPIMFVLSAMSGGMALLFFFSVVVFRIMRPGLVKDEALAVVAQIAGGLSLLCVYLRLWDWAVTYYYSFNQLIDMQAAMLTAISPYSSWLKIGQFLMGSVFPGFVLLMYRKGKNLRLAMFASALSVFCVILMRWDYNFSGFIARISYAPFVPEIKQSFYMPTWQEIAVGTGVLSYWLLGFSLAARFLPFHDPKADEPH